MNSNANKHRILIMTAVSAERDAVLRGLKESGRRLDPDIDAGAFADDNRAAGVKFDVALAGVGPASAAARTAIALTRSPAAPYDLVISAGIGGGFPALAEIGSLVVSTRIVAADLGSQTPEGFLSVDELGFGESSFAVDAALADRVAAALNDAGLRANTGPVLTVSTATGTAATATERAERILGAAAEAMEGFGVATAAHLAGIPALELRAISNAVGPRDRSAWRIREALEVLEAACSTIKEVNLLP